MINEKTLERRRERDQRMHDEATAAGKTPVAIVRSEVALAQVKIEILIDGKDLTPGQERIFTDYVTRMRPGVLGAACFPGTAGD